MNDQLLLLPPPSSSPPPPPSLIPHLNERIAHHPLPRPALRHVHLDWRTQRQTGLAESLLTAAGGGGGAAKKADELFPHDSVPVRRKKGGINLY